MNYLIVAGGREFDDALMAQHELDEMVKLIDGHDQVTIIEGGAKGADYFGYLYAMSYNLPHIRFEADWETHGRSAGPIRNIQMAEKGTHLLAFWDGKSRGTKHMIDTAVKKGLTVKVVYYEDDIR